jgi:hypothetical protein
MKSTTRARGQNIKVNVRYSSYNDVTFMTVQAGVVSMRGSVEGRGIPDVWHVEVGTKNWGRCVTSDLKLYTMRGRGIAAMIKAMRTGRI